MEGYSESVDLIEPFDPIGPVETLAVLPGSYLGRPCPNIDPLWTLRCPGHRGTQPVDFYRDHIGQLWPPVTGKYWPVFAHLVLGPRRRTRGVLALCLLGGLVHAVTFPLANPPQIGLATDVYHHVGTAFLDGRAFYGVHPPDHPGFAFLYPPPVILATVPFAVVGSEMAAYLLGWLLNGIAVVALWRITIEIVDRSGGMLDTIDRLLVGGFFVITAPAITTLIIGQVNLLLALGIAWGTLALEDERSERSGIAFGLTALVKLFPALIGAWLLRRRAWRTILAATVSGLGALALGLAIPGPESFETYLTVVLPGEMSVGAFPAGPDPTAPYMGIRRQLSVLVPGLESTWLLPLSLAIVTPLVLASYRSVETLVDRLLALEATMVATLLVLPFEPFYVAYVAFPTVALLYIVEERPIQGFLLAGTLISTAPVTYSGLLSWAEALPGLADLLGPLLRPLFAFALPAGVGLWLLLIGCVLGQSKSLSYD